MPADKIVMNKNGRHVEIQRSGRGAWFVSMTRNGRIISETQSKLVTSEVEARGIGRRFLRGDKVR